MANRNIPVAKALYEEMSEMYESNKGKHKKKECGGEGGGNEEVVMKTKKFLVDNKSHLTQKDFFEILKSLPKE